MFDKMVDDASDKARSILLEERRPRQEIETEWQEQKADLEEDLRKASETHELLQEQLDELIAHRETDGARWP